VVSWRNLRSYFVDERAETGRETICGWFQWRAEQYAKREGSIPPVPAHVQYRDRKPR
jgi:hypothetical protein